MDLVDLILVLICGTLLLISLLKDAGKTKKALKIGAKTFLNTLEFFIVVFALIGLFEVLLSKELVIALMGSSKGILAPIVAAVVGSLATGPPAAAYPLAKFLLTHQASAAAVATFLVAWVAVGTVSLPVEMRFLGKRFAITRWLVTLISSIIIGLIMGWLLWAF